MVLTVLAGDVLKLGLDRQQHAGEETARTNDGVGPFGKAAHVLQGNWDKKRNYRIETPAG